MPSCGWRILRQPIDRDADRDRQRRTVCERLHGRVEALVAEHCGMDTSSKIAQFPERRLDLRFELADEPSRGVALVEPRFQQLETDADPEQPLLGAVVEIPLDSASLRVGREDEPRARVAQLGQLGS